MSELDEEQVNALFQLNHKLGEDWDLTFERTFAMLVGEGDEDE